MLRPSLFVALAILTLPVPALAQTVYVRYGRRQQPIRLEPDLM